MPTRSLLIIALLAGAFTLAGCQKSEGDANGKNAATEIEIAKKDDTLASVAHNVLGKRADSLGFKLQTDGAYYDSGSLSLSGNFREEGHPIYKVEQPCTRPNQLPLGPDFDGIGCGTDSVAKLAALAKSESGKIKEFCVVVDVNPAQDVAGYVNTQNNAFWDVYQGVVTGIGISDGKDNPLALEAPVAACDLKARADANKWHKPIVMLGNVVGGCELDEKGPGAFIQGLETLHMPYTIVEEVKEGDKIVQTTIQIAGRGELRYFRGKSRCESYAKNEVRKNETSKSQTQKKYE
jgi:hypothetical protein